MDKDRERLVVEELAKAYARIEGYTEDRIETMTTGLRNTQDHARWVSCIHAAKRWIAMHEAYLAFKEEKDATSSS